MALDERLVDLLMRAEELRAQGQAVAAEELCCDCPELLPGLRELQRGTAAVEKLLNAPSASATAAPAAPAAGVPCLPGYTIHGELGRGGMGVVYEAMQEALGRRVALKVLPVLPGEGPDRLARFRREARAAARLQHPNIVPVFEVGQVEGAWFYAMQLIPGRSLSALLGDLRRPQGESTVVLSAAATPHAPARDTADAGLTYPAAAPAGPARGLAGLTPDADPRGYYREVARVGQQVAEALACAHAHGILHRDVKPANLLLDPEGRVWVADFGLAKVEEDEDLTQSGVMLGTLRYMAPEQARGAPEVRSDVYSLGLTLYELLTFRPAFDAPDYLQLLEQVNRQEPPRPRSLDRRIPRDLETIVLKAIDKDPRRRYATAQDFADDLGRFRAGEPVRARRTPAWERALKWARRRPAAATLLTVGLLAALALVVSGLAYDARLRREQEETDRQQLHVQQGANEAIAGARDFHRRSRAARGQEAAGLAAQAREQAQRAWNLVENGPAEAALVERVRELRAELAEDEKGRKLQAALEAAGLAQADTDARKGQFSGARAVPLFRQALQAYGLPAGAGDPRAVAAQLGRQPPEVRQACLDAFDEWVVLAEDPSWGVKEPHLGWLRAVLAAAEPEGWGKRVRDAAAEKDAGRRRAALERLAATADVDHLPAHALRLLSRRLARLPAWESAVALLRRARVPHAGDFWLNHDLAWALMSQARPEGTEAVRHFTAAVAVRPDSAGARVNLGLALEAEGRPDQALAEYRQAVALDLDYVDARLNLGALLLRLDRVDEAVAELRTAVKKAPREARAHNNLGLALAARGEQGAALAAYDRALALAPKYAGAHSNRGLVLAAQGKWQEALVAHQTALALEPDNASAHNNLGTVYAAQNQRGLAIAEYRKALAQRPNFILALLNLGANLAAQRQFDEATAVLEKVLTLNPKEGRAHHELGIVRMGQGKTDQAIAAFRMAIALKPKFAPAHVNLGVALNAQGKVDEAIAAYRQAIALAPKEALAHYNLGATLKDQNKWDEAITEFRQALASNPKHAPAQGALTKTLLLRGRFGEAHASARRWLDLLPKGDPLRGLAAQLLQQCAAMHAQERQLPRVLAGEVQPASAAEGLQFACVCQLKRLHAGAARLFRDTFAAAPWVAGDLNGQNRFNAACNAALAGCGQGEDAAQLSAQDRAGWRGQALDWLWADLLAYGKILEGGPPQNRPAIAQRLRHWLENPTLAGLRDAVSLNALPAEEREACRRLWVKVRRMIAKAGVVVLSRKPQGLSL